ncbi:piezo-type mechanosensitive ion channel component-like [Euwallacea fornicatus]|uniref:piezo-type mechanosensitive ion channel component-like n=1 Tax=Euwallacea fornicatus TaxID=995702 RepID=UPI00338E8016
MIENNRIQIDPELHWFSQGASFLVAFYRPTMTSYIYLIFGCYMPFFSVPAKDCMMKATRFYMKALITSCFFTSSLVLSFYLIQYFSTNKIYDVKYCSAMETAMRTLGIVKYNGLSAKDAFNWVLPEPLMLVGSIGLYVAFKKLVPASEELGESATAIGILQLEERQRKKIVSYLSSFGKYFSCFLLCVTAVLSPSIVGAFYYLVFLGIVTYWAFNQPLSRVLACTLTYLLPVYLFHLTLLFIYQLQYLQDHHAFQPATIGARLLGLVSLRTYKDCTDPRIFVLHPQPKSNYALPYILYGIYHISVLVARQMLQAEDGIRHLLVASFHWKRENMDTQTWELVIKEVQVCSFNYLIKVFNSGYQLKKKIRLEKDTEIEEALLLDKLKITLNYLQSFLFKFSPLLGNFLMMIWAIAYLCWTSFCLLILANLVWLMPTRKQAMLSISPLMAVIMHIMLFGQYLYSLNLTEEELPSKMGALDFRPGFQIFYSEKWIALLAKSLMGIVIFITLRHFVQQKSMRKKEAQLAQSRPDASEAEPSLESPEPSLVDSTQAVCLKFFSLWWMWVVILTMIWMEFWSSNSLFRIAFVGLAVVFLMTFQLCSFTLWKNFLPFYWWIVMVYAMLNLVVLYMFQIDIIRSYMLKLFTLEQYEEFGCWIWTGNTEKLVAMATPIFFQIAVAVQQNYFQSTFHDLTEMETPEQLTQRLKVMEFKVVAKTFARITDIFFTILEIHLPKIILLIGWLMCVFDLCAVFVPLVLPLTLASIMGRRFTKIITYIISCFVQIFIVLRLIYMNQYNHHHDWDYVRNYARDGVQYNVTLNTADWLGFHESRLGKSKADFPQLVWCFGFVFAVTLDRIVNIRMQNYRDSRRLRGLHPTVIFPEITYGNSHDNLKSLLKFLANYGFYKLGCEITLLYAGVVIVLRMDAVAIILVLWLLAMFPLKRERMRILWLPSILFLVVLIFVQYLFTLGWWPKFFDNSLTSYWNSKYFLLRLQQFCHLMNMANPPMKDKIILDFILLLIMSRQWKAFKMERKLAGIDLLAGSNTNVHHLIDDPTVQNPIPDFTTVKRNSLDYFNNVLFTSWFYLSLLATFLVGTMRPSIYSYGFILGALVFLWEGSNVFLRPPNTILLRWNLLLAYNILIMVAKTISQLFGCVLIHERNRSFSCRLLKFFSVGCVEKFQMAGAVPELSITSWCLIGVPLGLGWNCVNLFFLLGQQRIFKSYYFIHIVNNTKAHTILADRGANLIEENRRKMRETVDNERISIEKNIKKKMETIKANASKIAEIRNGIYTNFDEIDRATDVPLLPSVNEANDTDNDRDNVGNNDDNDTDADDSNEGEHKSYDPMPISEYFGLYHTTDIDVVLKNADSRSRRKEALIRKAQGKAAKGEKTDDSESLHSLRTVKILRFTWGAFESLIVSITLLIDQASKDFRKILDEMDFDKKTLKDKTSYTKGVRLGSNKIWHPAATYEKILNEERQNPKKKRELLEYSIYIKLPRACWYLLMAYSESLCYLTILVYQIMGSTFISLPILLMTFCWGALTVPKPSKTYWIINIAYVLIMALIKNFFDLEIVPWKGDWNQYHPFFPPRLLGLFNNLKGMTLLMLISMSFHRAVLLNLGLWKPYRYRTTTLIADGRYQVKNGKFVSISPETGRGQSDIVEVSTTNISIGDYFPKSIAHGASKYAEGFKLYIQQLIAPSLTQIPKDVYMPMFLCDLVNLFLIVFCFGSFINAAKPQGFIQFTHSNTVPTSYIFIVLIYMFSMMIDRALYMRKNRYGKLVYHLFQVITIHIWFFIMDPLLMKRKLQDSAVLQGFYFFKTLYFLFSASQIRNGYPTIISYHYFWHGYTVFHRYGYKIYRLIPYLLEIRCLLDWICSDSCLGFQSWFKFEGMTQSLFDQKCQQEYESKGGVPSGQCKSRRSKLVTGGFLFVCLVFTVIFPLVLFSLSTKMGVTTRPQRIQLELYMGRALPIFTAHVRESNIIQMSQHDYENLSSTFNNIYQSNEIFNSFQPEDTIVVKWSRNSLFTWDISAGSKMELLEELFDSQEFPIRLEIHYVHVGGGGEQSYKTFGQNTYVPPLPNEDRQNLIDMVKSENDSNIIARFPMIFPKFMSINKEGNPRVLTLMEESLKEHSSTHDPKENLSTGDYEDEALPPNGGRLRDILVRLYSNKRRTTWWQIQEKCSAEDDNYIYYLSNLVYNDCESLVLYIFNEKIFSGAINVLASKGIFGLYLIYFMMIIKAFRACRADMVDIWITDLPNTNKLFRKCMEVYIARDMKNFELENENFQDLVAIMRSKEVLIKLSRYENNSYNPTFVIPETSS